MSFRAAPTGRVRRLALHVLQVLLPGLLCVYPAAALAQAPTPDRNAVKWHPGHYVTLVEPAGEDPAYMREVLDELDRHTVLRGVQIRYTWAQLEPEAGVYRFEAIDRDLAALAARGKRLFILLQTKSFDDRRPAAPAWLRASYYDGGVFRLRAPDAGPVQRPGENIRLWHSQVKQRLTGLVQALGRRFDAHPALEGISMTETAMGRPEGGPISTAVEQRFFEHLREVVGEMRRAFPHTVTLQFVNYPRRMLPSLIGGMRELGVGLGGPDVFLDDPGLLNGVYPYYARLAGVVPLAPSVQHDNYLALRARGPVEPQEIAEIYAFARDRLHANYLFWTRRYYKNDRPYAKVLTYFQSSGFPREDPAGGLATACPSAYAACAP